MGARAWAGLKGGKGGGRFEGEDEGHLGKGAAGDAGRARRRAVTGTEGRRRWGIFPCGLAASAWVIMGERPGCGPSSCSALRKGPGAWILAGVRGRVGWGGGRVEGKRHSSGWGDAVDGRLVSCISVSARGGGLRLACDSYRLCQ